MVIEDIKFELDDLVVTPFGNKGIIRMIGYNEGGIQYYVLMENAETWFAQDELKEYASRGPGML